MGNCDFRINRETSFPVPPMSRGNYPIRKSIGRTAVRGRIFTESKIILSEKGGAKHEKETVLIAVYGTLRSGECNERFCRNAISRRIATIPGTPYDTGWGFPAFVPNGKTKVSVELIEIPIRERRLTMPLQNRSFPA